MTTKVVGRSCSSGPDSTRYAPNSGELVLVVGDSNLAFGGPMKNRLFILASHTLDAVFLNRRGVQWR